MASREIAASYNLMTTDMQRRLNTYYTNLHSQFGNREVVDQEYRNRVAQKAHEVHKEATRNAELLKEAYASLQAKNREEHADRMAKHQVGRTEASRRVSQHAEKTQSRTARPRKQQQAASGAARPSAA